MPARYLHWPGSSANGDLKVFPNKHLCAIICVIWAMTTDKEYNNDEKTSPHLDSHANMTVAGCHATVINKSGKSADVRPFTKDCSKMIAVPIVDVAIACASIIGRIKAAVGPTAASVDADTEVAEADATNDEAGADALLLKFGSKFANVGSKSKNKRTTG